MFIIDNVKQRSSFKIKAQIKTTVGELNTVDDRFQGGGNRGRWTCIDNAVERPMAVYLSEVALDDRLVPLLGLDGAFTFDREEAQTRMDCQCVRALVWGPP